MSGVRWSKPTRQVEGRKTEKKVARKEGARVHPMSGAGSIKHDMSTEDVLIEMKDANLSHTVKGSLLLSLFQTAVRQNKTPIYMIKFSNGLTLRGYIERE